MYSPSQNQRIQTATAAPRLRRRKTKVGDFIADWLEWAWFVTITFACSIGRDHAFVLLLRFLLDLELAAKDAIGWVLVEDFGPENGAYHVHGLIAGVSHLRRNEWWNEMHTRFGRSEIRKYDDGRGARYYIAGRAIEVDAGVVHLGGRLLEGRNITQIAGVRIINHANAAPGAGSGDRTVGSSAYEIHIDGAGSRPDGTGSGFAFVNVTTGRTGIRRIDGLTNNQAEYHALIYVLLNLEPDSSAKIYSDSQLVVSQFNKKWIVKDPDLRSLLKKARKIIRLNSLRITLAWVPRAKNLAGKLL